MILVPVLLADPAGLLAVGVFGPDAVVSIERSPTIDGSYAVIVASPILATTVQYDFWDVDGDETSWYRWRVASDDTGSPTSASPYSAPLAGTSPTTEVVSASYAGLGDVLALMETRPQAARLVRLAKLLGPMSEEINREIGRDFFRHPAVTGTETRYFPDGPGPAFAGRYGRLCVHKGIISLTSLEIRLSPFNDYELVDPGDWQLEPLTPELGRPYDHIRLLGITRWSSFPSAPSAIRAVGAFGWATPPRVLVEANAERARQVAYADGSYSGSQAGPDEYGAARPFTPLPDVLWRFMTSETRRYACSL